MDTRRAGHHSKVAKDEAPELLCQLLNLSVELLVAIATQLAEDDELAASLACKLRVAVVGTERRVAGARLSTAIGSALSSAVKLEWAASCGMPLNSNLLTRAARHGQLEPLRWLRAHGQLEPLRWLRAHGCAWGPLPLGVDNPCSEAANSLPAGRK
jgi:hypothetical protein